MVPFTEFVALAALSRQGSERESRAAARPPATAVVPATNDRSGRARFHGRLTVSADERRQLERWGRGRTTPQRLALRSRIVLLLAGGRSLRRAAIDARTSVRTVILWRDRFLAGGVNALTHDAPGRGRKPILEQRLIQAIAAECGSGGVTRATIRTVARKYGVSRSTVHRIWRRLTPQVGGAPCE